MAEVTGMTPYRINQEIAKEVDDFSREALARIKVAESVAADASAFA